MKPRALWIIGLAFLIAATLEATVFGASVPEQIDNGIASPARSTEVAVRGVMVQVRPVPPLPPAVPVPTPGNCASWQPVFYWYGATDTEVAFFVPSILWRESRCGADVLNEASGDSGPCQINPIHNRAGYFGRRFYGDGGWLHALHGLRTRQDLHNPEWINACITMYRVCSSGPWVRPYSCANRRYP